MAPGLGILMIILGGIQLVFTGWALVMLSLAARADRHATVPAV